MNSKPCFPELNLLLVHSIFSRRWYHDVLCLLLAISSQAPLSCPFPLCRGREIVLYLVGLKAGRPKAVTGAGKPSNQSINQWLINQSINQSSASIDFSPLSFFAGLEFAEERKIRYFEIGTREDFLNALSVVAKDICGPSERCVWFVEWLIDRVDVWLLAIIYDSESRFWLTSISKAMVLTRL